MYLLREIDSGRYFVWSQILVSTAVFVWTKNIGSFCWRPQSTPKGSQPFYGNLQEQIKQVRKKLLKQISWNIPKDIFCKILLTLSSVQIIALCMDLKFYEFYSGLSQRHRTIQTHLHCFGFYTQHLLPKSEMCWAHLPFEIVHVFYPWILDKPTRAITARPITTY